MLDRIRHNFVLKLLAMGIALALWGYLRLTPNPVIARARFEQQMSVPLTTTGLDPDDVARFTEKQAVVSVELPTDGATVKPDMVQAVLNLEGRGPGVYNVPVEVVAPKLDIKSLSPASVTLSIEKIQDRQLPVSIHYVGVVRPNIVVSSTSMLPQTATLRAPTNDLASVAGVRVDLPLSNTPETIDEMLRPVAIDAEGRELPAIAVTPNLVRVHARFVASAGKK